MDIVAIQKMLDSGQDGMILRFGLGQALLKSGQAAEAIAHFEAALQFDPNYSAAWKQLARALLVCDKKQQAIETYQKGISVAEKKVIFRPLKKCVFF